MRTIHFCVESFDPRDGGMEGSAVRVARYLASMPETRVIAYAMEQSRAHDAGIPVVDVAKQVMRAVAPFAEEPDWVEPGLELYRARMMVLRNAVERDRAEHGGEHLLLSFYITTSGFVAQHVANELHLPHIACSRGSDIGRDLYAPFTFARVDYVLRTATALVATNRAHERAMRDFTHREQGITTIYNALPPITRTWQPQRRERVRIASVGGYTVKKGTHLLFDAVSRLLDERLPIELAIVGPSARQPYWSERRRELASRYGDAVQLNHRVPAEEIESFLLGGDVFCSASFSEGCSNATMLALALGMPIVSTATGALVDFASDCAHVALVPPMDRDALTDALRDAVVRLLRGEVRIDGERVQQAMRALTVQDERKAWSELIRSGVLAG